MASATQLRAGCLMLGEETMMTDKQPMQGVPKNDDGAKEKDGVNDAPAKEQGGESGGGAYPNPHEDK